MQKRPPQLLHHHARLEPEFHKRILRQQTLQNPDPLLQLLRQPSRRGTSLFRLLCHESRIGGVIGKGGNIIKGLQQQTGAKIRIEDAPLESPDRVITIVGSVTQSAVLFGGNESAIEVSRGQEALVGVFERILEVGVESDSVAGGVVSCRLLAEMSSIGAVIGKGGKIVEKIRKDCGCKVKVLIDKLPACASSNEEMIEIEGNASAVKKGLVAVSRRLQDCQPVDKTRVISSKPVEAVSRVSLPEVGVEILPQQSSVLPTIGQHSVAPPTVAKSSIDYSSRAHLFLLESERVSTLDTSTPQQPVVFRILCNNDRVGGVIGRGGNIVTAIQNETGAAISIGPKVAECNERLITVTASENPESRYSAAQKTVVLVFSRVVESIIEKGGTIISEMRKATSTSIRIIGREQGSPKCMPGTDHVVEILGDFLNVKDSIYHITGRLRDNLFSSIPGTPGARSSSSVLAETSPYVRLMDPARDAMRDSLRDPSWEPLRDIMRDPLRDPLKDIMRDPLRDPLRDEFRDPLREPVRDPLRGPGRGSLRERGRDSAMVGISHNLNRQTVITQSMDHLGFSCSLDHPPSPRLWGSQTIPGVNPQGISDLSGGLPFKSGLDRVSGGKSAFVTNTTIEIIVPEHAFGSVYGEKGSNLARLRQTIVVNEIRNIFFPYFT
ncbi:KH DOMAIN-CONTAINING PROTEIN HEN4 [Salix purpurea]|uniref:KH DOMAIN-CONTAINING PROTEIN HEN4 n=1 Tax=Salix purpurea TaxID=77065 RepID=A0A9Q0ZNP6_SALPP|nr:KH DOMAIN-CONTAINING PROTEIN HEN4 [Salix purpurea]